MDGSAVAGDVDAGRSFSCEPMAAAERRVFERDGYLVVRECSTPTRRKLLPRPSTTCTAPPPGVQLGPGAPFASSVAAYACPGAGAAIDPASVVRAGVSVLGWNVHVYHSHIDVHPPVAGDVPFRYEWHQDGGWQNKELETDRDAAVVGEGRLLAIGRLATGTAISNWSPAATPSIASMARRGRRAVDRAPGAAQVTASRRCRVVRPAGLTPTQ